MEADAMRTTRFRPWPAAALIVVMAIAAVPLFVTFSPAPGANGSTAPPDALDELREIANGSVPQSGAIHESRPDTASVSTAQPNAIDELRREFASVGPPDFKAIIEETTSHGSLVSMRKTVTTAVRDGTIRSEQEEHDVHRGELECTHTKTATDFFSGMIDDHLLASFTIRCSSAHDASTASMRSEIEIPTVTDLKGRLFPLAPGNELSFRLKRKNAFAAALFPDGVPHQLTVVDVLKGATLNLTGGPDIIYLLRHEYAAFKGDKPFLVEIYWSSALRWPIQLRLRSHAANLTFLETNLIGVAGVQPYTLPDGRSFAGLDRTRIAVSAGEMELVAQKLKPVAYAEKDEADRGSTRRLVGALVAPEARPSNGLKPAFATIAPFVTVPR
jgi:hypothetical protein